MLLSQFLTILSILSVLKSGDLRNTDNTDHKTRTGPKSAKSGFKCTEIWGHPFLSRRINMNTRVQHKYQRNASSADCARLCQRDPRCSCSVFTTGKGGSCLFYSHQDKNNTTHGIVPSRVCPLITQPSPWNKQCSQSQTELLAQLLAKMRSEGRRTDGVTLARDIVHKLRSRQLSFIGDAISSQHFAELVCAIVESTALSFAVESRDCRGLWGSSICVRFWHATGLAGAKICYTRFDIIIIGIAYIKSCDWFSSLLKIIIMYSRGIVQV